MSITAGVLFRSTTCPKRDSWIAPYPSCHYSKSSIFSRRVTLTYMNVTQDNGDGNLILAASLVTGHPRLSRPPMLREHPCNERSSQQTNAKHSSHPLLPSAGLHADRTPCRDLHHRDLGRPDTPRCPERSGSSPQNPVPQQPAQYRNGDP